MLRQATNPVAKQKANRITGTQSWVYISKYDDQTESQLIFYYTNLVSGVKVIIEKFFPRSL